MHLDTYAFGTPQELEQVAGWWTAQLRKPGAQGWREWSCFESHERSYARLARVIEGALDERVFVAGDPPRWREQRWTSGTAHRLPADHLHEVWNESGRDAWSLHVYAPRLVTMRFYGAASSDRLAPLRSETASSWL